MAYLRGCILKISVGSTLWGVATGCGLLPFPGDGEVQADEIPDIGWEAEIHPFVEKVSGVATIVDRRTIEIRDFTYDGGGLNTRFYLVADGLGFSDEIELSGGNWVRGEPYEGETVRLEIPEEAPTGEWNLITLWEVPVGVSFGHGQFLNPDD
ncbi:MAG: DM13 domain-containing protein [Proteobacteria bacterium]|jgi:hypothetical protein|nr:DM13 domain-containing protein [Pseudomonadota bacterium]